jgi:hypothetical protein
MTRRQLFFTLFAAPFVPRQRGREVPYHGGKSISPMYTPGPVGPLCEVVIYTHVAPPDLTPSCRTLLVTHAERRRLIAETDAQYCWVHDDLVHIWL